MNSKHVLAALEDYGAFIRDTHVVLASGDKPDVGNGPHGDAYVNFKKLYAHVPDVFDIAAELAGLMAAYDLDAVVGPPMGGTLLATTGAFFLSLERRSGNHVLAPVAEKTAGPERFMFRPDYAELLAGRKVGIIEDVVKTADSILDLAKVVQSHGGIITAVGAVFDRRGGKGRSDPILANYKYLVGMELNEWPADACPLCARGVPVNTDVGHGKAFLARQAGR